MSLSIQAQKVFDRLPLDGSRVGGITLQRELQLSKLEYQKARDELKAEKLVVSGQGRGGSLARVEGAEPTKEKVVTKAERMEHAREAKQAKTRAKRELDEQMQMVIDYFAKEGYKIKREDISWSEDRPIAAVWNGSSAQMFGIPCGEWDRMTGRY